MFLNPVFHFFPGLIFVLVIQDADGAYIERFGSHRHPVYKHRKLCTSPTYIDVQITLLDVQVFFNMIGIDNIRLALPLNNFKVHIRQFLYFLDDLCSVLRLTHGRCGTGQVR
ncbi:hypothetical protein D3C87_1590590 [compost metagenome]